MFPAPSPISNGAPAHAARSPSPEHSMNIRPRIAARPDLLSTITASIARSARLAIPTPNVWKRIFTPLAISSSSAAILYAEMS